MALKAVWVAVAATAVAIGFSLPLLHGRAEPRSQIDQLVVGQR